MSKMTNPEFSHSRGMFSTFVRFLSVSCITICACGSGFASAATILDIAMVPRLNIQSEVGITNQIQYSADLSQSNWVTLTNLLVVQTNYWFVDMSAPPMSRRFYRVVTFPTSNAPPSGMVLVTAGSFTMGDTFNECDPDERPLHVVNVSAFYMDQYEVTKYLWDDVYAWAI